MSLRFESDEFGAFEQHTRGIGSKLLKRWGWKEGEGLGPTSSGITEPIQPTVNPSRQSLDHLLLRRGPPQPVSNTTSSGQGNSWRSSNDTSAQRATTNVPQRPTAAPSSYPNRVEIVDLTEDQGLPPKSAPSASTRNFANAINLDDFDFLSRPPAKSIDTDRAITTLRKHDHRIRNELSDLIKSTIAEFQALTRRHLIQRRWVVEFSDINELETNVPLHGKFLRILAELAITGEVTDSIMSIEDELEHNQLPAINGEIDTIFRRTTTLIKTSEFEILDDDTVAALDERGRELFDQVNALKALLHLIRSFVVRYKAKLGLNSTDNANYAENQKSTIHLMGVFYFLQSFFTELLYMIDTNDWEELGLPELALSLMRPLLDLEARNWTIVLLRKWPEPTESSEQLFESSSLHVPIEHYRSWIKREIAKQAWIFRKWKSFMQQFVSWKTHSLYGTVIQTLCVDPIRIYSQTCEFSFPSTSVHIHSIPQVILTTLLPHIATSELDAELENDSLKQHNFNRWKASVLLQLLEEFGDLAPLEGIVNMIISRMVSEVKLKWNPTENGALKSLYDWYEGFRQALGDSDTNLVELTISKKIHTLLIENWNAEDDSVLQFMVELNRLFPAVARLLRTRVVVPQLKHWMSQVVIDPSNQSLVELRRLLAWRQFVTQQEMNDLLSTAFFPRWLSVLADWISDKNEVAADIQELMCWYRGWKQFFVDEGIIPGGPDSNGSEQLLPQFNKALHMLDVWIDKMQRSNTTPSDFEVKPTVI